MKYTVEEIEKIITDTIKDFHKNDFKKRAIESMKEIKEKTGKKYPEIAYIILDYPDFNSFVFRIEDKKTFRVEFCISPDILKTPEKIHQWAEYISACMGGSAVDDKEESKK